MEETDDKLISRLKKIKEQVIYLLNEYPAARNNDFYLLYLWLRKFGGVEGLPYLEWSQMGWLSGKPATIIRVRRSIQKNYPHLKPTIKHIEEKREAMSQSYRRVMPQFDQQTL